MNRGIDDGQVAPTTVAAVVEQVEAELDSFVTGVADRVAARIQATQGRLAAAHQVALRRGVLTAIRDALARLRSQAELPRELPPDLNELARLTAGCHYELAEIADVWLVGQEVFWEQFEVVSERTLKDAAVCWDVLKAARLRLRGHAIHVSGLFREAYETQLTRAVGVRDQSQLLAVSRALDGHWVEPSELGYDLANHHIAVVTDAPPSPEALTPRIDLDMLLVEAPDGGTWGWFGGRTEISGSDIDALVAGDGSWDGHIAFGEPAAGIAGFAASHHQALEARTIAVATDQRAVRFGDLRLLLAVLRDRDLASAFIERELGELDRPGERMRELRETLRAYLEHGQSVSATAALRRRDRKTIERQLRSAEELIRHRVSDRSDELLIALRIAEILRHYDDGPATRAGHDRARRWHRSPGSAATPA
jgi:hypothetical protein